MPKAKLNLQSRTDDDLAAYCANHKTKMTGNATFSSPMPSAAIFDAALTDFQTELASFRAAQDTATQMRVAKDAAREVLEYAMTQRSSYVETTATSEAQMLSAGVDSRPDLRFPSHGPDKAPRDAS